MSLRDEIRQEIIEAIYEGADHMNLPWRYPEPKPEEHTDAIIALVRDRLTSDAAVKAAVTLTETPDIAHDASVLGVTDEDIRAAEWKRAQDAITAALDAALGEGKTA